MSTQKQPISVHPDSSADYSFTNIAEMVGTYKENTTVAIKNSNQKKLADIIIALNQLRTTESATELPVFNPRINEIINNLNLHEHEINEILNAILINRNEYAARSSDVYTLDDIVMFLLYVNPKRPICGRIMLVKQVFLAIKEIFGDKNVENPKFVPYKYGPYSFLLGSTLSNMRYDGVIQIDGKKNTASEKFLITDKGIEIVKIKFDNISKKKQRRLVEKRKGWDQSHRKGMLNYVYNKYPEYTVHSEISHKYKTILWGRGRG